MTSPASISLGTLTDDAPTSAPLAKSPPTALLLAAVSMVVILISMPRLAHWAAANNQEDAAKAAQVLGPLLASAPEAHTLGTLVRSTPLLRHRFSDARPLGAGHMVDYHGYLLARGEGGVLFAWPRERGRTGQVTYAWTPERGLLVHQGSRSSWSGVQRCPKAQDLQRDGWQPHP